MINRENLEKNEQWAAFYEKYYPKGIRYMRLFIYNDEEARDVVSNIFLNMLEQSDRLAEANAEAWFFSMVRSRGLDYVRRLKCLRKVEERMKQTADRYSDDEFVALCQREMFRIIGQTLSEMDSTQERVFREIRLEGRSYSDVEQDMNISKRSVEYQLRKATEKVRKRLMQMYG